MNTAQRPDTYRKSHLVIDDVYSFVLRLHLNPAPGGQGRPRPQYNLENVNKGTKRRMQNLDEVLHELKTQIDLILQNADSGVN